MCIFHLTDDHDRSSCLEMVRYSQLIGSKEVLNEVSEEESSRQLGNSEIHFLEYESNLERGVTASTSRSKETNELWVMEFDGSCSISSSGAGVVLISPSRKYIPFSFKLEFKNTINSAEYEALLLGLSEAKKLGVQLLWAKGDVELIVKQVRGLFNVKNERLRHYRNRV
ncbi:uncharacterized protein LOC131857844 [Cryptomeria japonica]|uniref:uncharacterized protein LOC131857844 n=1 Tax=Cryptomeria japonica TaxID=3369 RepID=UPI0027DAAA98|nr:uncharacterized protein LOC131857844 [Cryptomeria japonica]